MKRRHFLTSLAAATGAAVTGCRETAQKTGKQGMTPAGDVIREPEREIPVIARPDVLVVGGGPAGVAAAIAAGRAGAKTMLAERYNHLGGLWTGGLVLPLFCPRTQWIRTENTGR